MKTLLLPFNFLHYLISYNIVQQETITNKINHIIFWINPNAFPIEKMDSENRLNYLESIEEYFSTIFKDKSVKIKHMRITANIGKRVGKSFIQYTV